jgi:ligand-binding sensor domain-containing protein
MPKGSIYAATQDAANRLWAGGREFGLFWYDGNVWRELLLNGKPVPGWITSLQVRGTDELWIGTADQGIFRIALQGILE